MKKKIGILLPSINAGGAERAATRVSSILSDEYEIFVIVFSDKYLKYDFSGTLINLNTDFLNSKNKITKIRIFFKRIMELKKVKKKYKLDAVISYMDSPNLINILARDKKCSTVTSVRNFNFINKNFFGKQVYKFVHNRANKIIVVSEFIKKSIVEEFKIEKQKIETIYNPYDIDEIELESQKLDAKDMELFQKDTFKFISVGRIAYQKGFWHLIKAFNELNKKTSNIELFIVGRDESDGQAERLVKKMGLENKIHFLGYQKNPFKFVKSCDVYVLSSLYEGFPNSLVEAMALGKPVIATNCKSGPSEILSDKQELEIQDIKIGEYGILVPELDIVQDWDNMLCTVEEKILCDAMERIIEEDLYRHLSERAHTRSKEFNYEVCKNKYKSVIGKL